MSKHKHVSKKELAKVKPGTYLEVVWADSPPTVAILLDFLSSKRDKGEVELRILEQGSNSMRNTTHTQVVAIRGPVIWPTALQYPSTYRIV